MRMALGLLALVLMTTAADAKCLKGKRVIDNLTRSECLVLRGEWVDARSWPRPKKRAARPQ